MNKFAMAIASTLVALMAVFSSAAEAGSKFKLGFGGPLPHFTAYGQAPSTKAKTPSKRKARKDRAKKKTVVKRAYKPKALNVSKAKVVPKASKSVATTEQSSISSASGSEPKAETRKNVVEATLENEPETSKEIGCKKFFPSVAMTLTVPCE